MAVMKLMATPSSRALYIAFKQAHVRHLDLHSSPQADTASVASITKTDGNIVFIVCTLLMVVCCVVRVRVVMYEYGFCTVNP